MALLFPLQIKTSLFKRVLIGSSVSLLFSLSVVISCLYYLTESTYQKTIETKKTQVVPFIEKRQEQWRLWKQFKQEAALNHELIQYAKILDVESIDVVDSSVLKEKFPPVDVLILPQNDETLESVPLVIRVKIGESHPWVLKDFFFFGALVLIILSFLSILLAALFNLWLKRKIFTPLYQLISELKEAGSVSETEQEQANVDEISFFVQSFANLNKRMKEHEKGVAIAMTTQMLAHDIRRPLAMVKVVLAMLKREFGVEIGNFGRFHDEIDYSLKKADDLISDVMIFGSKSPLQLSKTSIKDLMIDVLHDISRINEKAKISFSFDLAYPFLIEVDGTKIYRAVSNLIANAYSAMNLQGHIHISSSIDELSQSCLIRIKNTNSYIPKNLLKNLFDAFVTGNKRGGHGLGLAIVKKVIEEHGGQIWCESCEETKVTSFSFRIPENAEKYLDHSQTPLPKSSNDFARINSNLQPELCMQTARERIGKHVAAKNRKIRIGILDDENTYAIAFHRLFLFEQMHHDLELLVFERAFDLMSRVQEVNLDCLICDIDLNDVDLDGYDVIADLRAKGHSFPICLHSNRRMDFNRAASAGAQAVLPKPMTFSQLTGFIEIHILSGV